MEERENVPRVFVAVGGEEDDTFPAGEPDGVAERRPLAAAHLGHDADPSGRQVLHRAVRGAAVQDERLIKRGERDGITQPADPGDLVERQQDQRGRYRRGRIATAHGRHYNGARN
ncbi:MAG: hypothetical protein A3C53_07965 [Omnitrophica WOR_2 bacterium RIFCSPHIGHO2_02_FULL_68_15]|nr:MAG: hypothetical protein A3C53_07965 [Omnitrophica WOR_2 bacterium RIFCSPHIGHO2_02_FULL_68_15]